mgnify:CR=1 FL=1
MRVFSHCIAIVLFLSFTFPLVGQTTKLPSFGGSAMMSKGDDSKEINSELTFYEDKLVVKSDKQNLLQKLKEKVA